MPPPPPLPPSRCPRAGLGRAAMPSDFISLLSADLDLESPKSLYSRGESGWGLGRGGGEARPGGARGVPVGARGKPGPVGPVVGEGERPMGSGGGGRGWGGVAAPPPRSRRPHGAQLPSAPGLCGTSRTGSPSPCPAPPHSSSTRPRPPQLRDFPPSPYPQTGPRAGAAAIGAPRPLLPGPSSPAKLPPNGRRGLEPVLGAGAPFFSPSRLFVRRRSTPLSLRPSPLPPLVGTAPLDQAFFLSSSSYCWKGPEFCFPLFPPMWHSNDFHLPLFYRDRGALPDSVLFLSCPRGTSSGTDAACPLRIFSFAAVQGFVAGRGQRDSHFKNSSWLRPEGDSRDPQYQHLSSSLPGLNSYTGHHKNVLEQVPRAKGASNQNARAALFTTFYTTGRGKRQNWVISYSFHHIKKNYVPLRTSFLRNPAFLRLLVLCIHPLIPPPPERGTSASRYQYLEIV